MALHAQPLLHAVHSGSVNVCVHACGMRVCVRVCVCKVLNIESRYSPSVFASLRAQPVYDELADRPTRDKSCRASSSLARGKPTGEPGVLPDPANLSKKGCILILFIVLPTRLSSVMATAET